MGEASNKNPQKRIITENAFYRQKIVKAVEKIENTTVLMKIYTVVETHLKILNE